MKKILFILLIVFLGGKANAQRIEPVYGLEGGMLVGGLSGVSGLGYTGSWAFNGSFWVDLMGVNRNDEPTVGLRIKLNYNYYDMQTGNGNSDLVIGETTIPVLLKFCLSSKTRTWKDENTHKTYWQTRGLFLFVGPQVGFPVISGNPIGPYKKMDYSGVAGGELIVADRWYFDLYGQTGFSTIFPSQPNIRLSGFTAGIGFRLL